MGTNLGVLSRIERIDRWGPVSTSHLATWKWKLVLLNNYHWKVDFIGANNCLDNWIGREYLSCKCFALKRTCSKCFAGRVVKCFALSSLPRLWDINALLWVD